MNTLARLMGETERLRQGRRIFVSSASVSAYKVANNKKQLLEGDHPLVLSLPASADSHSAARGQQRDLGLSLLEASVGPQLSWTLSSVNHVLRTASKWGEPTYLFANVVDTDPQAFVAVTLNKRTPPEELEHLEGVISRVCHFHIAESKPMQVPGPDQVVSALGKGLMKLMFGGSSSKPQRQSRSPPPPQPRQQQYAYGSVGPDTAASTYRTPEQERADYLASRGASGGAHVASAAAGTMAPQAGWSRRDSRDEGEDVPTAPVLPSQRTAMGVGDKAQAEARLAALKADMMRGTAEGGAPDVHSTRDTQPQPRQAAAPASHYPNIPFTDDDYNTSGRSGGADWQAHTPGTLSNPFTAGGHSGATTAGSRDAYADDGRWGAGAGAGRRRVYEDEDDQQQQQDFERYQQQRQQQARQLRYEEEARQAREEWDRAQREAAAAAARQRAPASPPLAASKPSTRVKYHEVKEPAGVGGSGSSSYPYGHREPAYAYAGAGGGGLQQQPEQQQEQEQQRKQQAPDWLSVLGKMIAGGPSYAPGAPDL